MSEVNEVKCSGPGCTAVFRSVEPFAKDVTYTCREHTGKAPDKVRLQGHSHDGALEGSTGKKPDLDAHDRNDR